VRPGREMSMHYFSCLGGSGVDPTKSASGHVTSNLCFCIRVDLWVTWWVPVRSVCEILKHYFASSMDLVRIRQNMCHDTSRRTCILKQGGSAGHVVHFGASRARNIDTQFFLGWAQCGSHQKNATTHHAELVFLHPV
jgi:hypothetical protein